MDAGIEIRYCKAPQTQAVSGDTFIKGHFAFPQFRFGLFLGVNGGTLPPRGQYLDQMEAGGVGAVGLPFLIGDRVYAVFKWVDNRPWNMMRVAPNWFEEVITKRGKILQTARSLDLTGVHIWVWTLPALE